MTTTFSPSIPMNEHGAAERAPIALPQGGAFFPPPLALGIIKYTHLAKMTGLNLCLMLGMERAVITNRRI